MNSSIIHTLRPINTEDCQPPPERGGDLPMRSNLCTHSTNSCFNSCVEQSHKDSVQKACGTTYSKTVRPAMRAQLHLPPLDLSWALMHTEIQARSKHTSQKVIAEQVVSPDRLFNLAARHFHIRKLTQLPLQINPWCCHLYNCLFPSTNMLYFCVLRTFFN